MYICEWIQKKFLGTKKVINNSEPRSGWSISARTREMIRKVRQKMQQMQMFLLDYYPTR